MLDQRLTDEQYCYVTTTGRRSGRSHTIEIWFGAEPGGSTLYLLSGGGDRADWVRNLQVTPDVRVRVADQEWDARGRVVDDPDEDERARQLVVPKYAGPGDDLSGWGRTALPVALDLVARGWVG